MEVYIEKGYYREGEVYVLKTLEDWDEYEQLLKERDPDFLEWNPNFYLFKEDFEKYAGKIWQDKNQLRYTLNGVPVYEEYEIVGIEDDEAMCDWYWVAKNVKDDNDIKYLLANDPDFVNYIK